MTVEYEHQDSIHWVTNQEGVHIVTELGLSTDTHIVRVPFHLGPAPFIPLQMTPSVLVTTRIEE